MLVGLTILARLFRRNMTLLRAIGAPARFVCATIWSYAMVLLAAGGLALGRLGTTVLAQIVSSRTDIAIPAMLGWPEIHFVAGFVGLASIAALAPAMAFQRQPNGAMLRM